MHAHRLLAPLAAIALAAPIGSLHAQLSLAVGPVTGYYHPYGHFDPASVYSTQLASDPSQLAGSALGASAQLRFTRRAAIEATVSTTRSTIPGGNTPGGPVPPTPARVTVATLVAQYDLSPRPSRVRLWLGAGPALVRHSDGGYSRYGTPTSLGGAASIAAAVPLRSRVELAANVSGVAYTLDVPMPRDLALNPGSLQHGAQRDLVMSIALRWRP